MAQWLSGAKNALDTQHNGRHHLWKIEEWGWGDVKGKSRPVVSGHVQLSTS